MINVGNTNQLYGVLVVLVGTMFVLLACASPEEVLPGAGPAEQFVRNSDHLQAVSYTHLTLPTNREV